MAPEAKLSAVASAAGTIAPASSQARTRKVRPAAAQSTSGTAIPVTASTRLTASAVPVAMPSQRNQSNEASSSQAKSQPNPVSALRDHWSTRKMLADNSGHLPSGVSGSSVQTPQ